MRRTTSPEAASVADIAQDRERSGEGPAATSSQSFSRLTPPVLIERRFGLDPASIAAARKLVEDLPLRVDVVDTARLLVTELATNALMHAGSEITLSIALDGDLHVEVVDDSSDMPVLVIDIDPVAAHGRGLRLVNRLASRWGAERRGRGKAVWFDLYAASAPSGPAR